MSRWQVGGVTGASLLAEFCVSVKFGLDFTERSSLLCGEERLDGREADVWEFVSLWGGFRSGGIDGEESGI